MQLIDSQLFSNIIYYDSSSFYKIEIMYKLVTKVIVSLGTERHVEYLQQMAQKKVCFIEHGGRKFFAMYNHIKMVIFVLVRWIFFFDGS